MEHLSAVTRMHIIRLLARPIPRISYNLLPLFNSRRWKELQKHIRFDLNILICIVYTKPHCGHLILHAVIICSYTEYQAYSKKCSNKIYGNNKCQGLVALKASFYVTTAYGCSHIGLQQRVSSVVKCVCVIK